MSEYFLNILKENYNEKKALFDQKIIKGSLKFYGLPMSLIKKIAKENLNYNISEINLHEIYELDLIYGFILAKKKMPLKEKLSIFKDFYKGVDNWAVVDSVASLFKLKEKDYNIVLEFVKNNYKSEDEFVARFAFMLLFVNFVKEEHLDDIFNFIDNEGKYYILMVKAWLLQRIYLINSIRVLNYLKNLPKNDKLFIYTKRKLLDSFRLSKEEKLVVKDL